MSDRRGIALDGIPIEPLVSEPEVFTAATDGRKEERMVAFRLGALGTQYLRGVSVIYDDGAMVKQWSTGEGLMVPNGAELEIAIVRKVLP